MASARRMILGGIPLWNYDGGATSWHTYALDTSTKYIAFVSQMPEAATISGVGFRYESRTGTPPTYRASLQSVDASSGAPTGTVLGGGSPASATFTPPASTAWNGTWREITLANSYTCTRGQLIALVIDYSAGTVDGSNYSTFTLAPNNQTEGRSRLPYVGYYTGSTWTTGLTFSPTFLLRSASSVYGRPISAFVRETYSSDSTPDEYALRFSLSSDWGTTYKVVGARLNMRTGAAGKSFKVALYSGTSELQNVTVDSDQLGSTAEHGVYVDVYFDEATLATLNFGDVYRLGVAALSTSQSIALYYYQSAAAGDLAAWPMGTEWHLSTRTDGGSWTDDATSRPLVELILDDWTVSSGGGGGAVRSRIQGGM